jgi:hypothetical protein
LELLKLDIVGLKDVLLEFLAGVSEKVEQFLDNVPTPELPDIYILENLLTI